MSERDIFVEALQIDDTGKQKSFLGEACGTDEPLRQRVEALLKFHERAEGFLESLPARQ